MSKVINRRNVTKWAVSAFISVALFLIVPGSLPFVIKFLVKAIIKKAIMTKMFG